eukprot:TRINITY_DN11383_c0_g1_i1.p1 TRINITY_DN11383_c0_g1~~TRINITY_DN11383_c0_g1_i1.p1  ORF type:complete len:393 (+),score=145.73 TRINITY_DN11383_c0_g1_i1:1016-2194(+)
MNDDEPQVRAPAQPKLRGWRTPAVVGAYITLYSLASIVTAKSKVKGKYPYNPVAVSLVVSITKLLFSISALYVTHQVPPLSELCSSDSLWDTLRFSFPGLVYLIDDNLYFAILYFLTPGEYTLYSNVKVLTTALALRMMLGRHVSPLQWSGLCILALGLTTSKTSAGSFNSLNLGHLLVLAVSVIGSTGDVYNEKLLKDSPDTSIHLQNAKLYVFSVAFNLVALVTYQNGSSESPSSYFGGWGRYTFALVVIGATQGLTLSVIFKFLDNIVKVQAVAASMVLTVLLSAALFGTEPSFGFYLGVGVVLNALFIYNYEKFYPAVGRPTPPVAPAERRTASPVHTTVPTGSFTRLSDFGELPELQRRSYVFSAGASDTSQEMNPRFSEGRDVVVV